MFSKLIRLNYLVWLSVGCSHDTNRIFYCDSWAICRYKPHEEHSPIYSVTPPFLCLFAISVCVEPSVSAHRQVSTRWVSDNQIPLAVLCVCVFVGGGEGTVTVKEGEDIPLYMPLRVSSAAFLNIAGKSLVSSCPESLANFLGFFTGY